MLDQKLQDWRIYQEWKRTVQLTKMDGRLPCYILFDNKYHKAYFHVKKDEHSENSIEVISREQRNGVPRTTYIRITMEDLRGYSRDGGKIILTLEEVVEEEMHEDLAEDNVGIEEELEQGAVGSSIVLQFMKRDVLETAFEAVEKFASQKKELSTPPSSSESDKA